MELKFIGDRSSIFGTNYSLRKIARKNEKNAPKIRPTKDCVVRFLYISVFILFFGGWIWGHRHGPHSQHPPTLIIRP